jgi:hypothetical protein
MVGGYGQSRANRSVLSFSLRSLPPERTDRDRVDVALWHEADMLNFKVIMVPDVLATWTDAEHNATLANFYSIFGDVQTCDEVLASLSGGQEATAA